MCYFPSHFPVPSEKKIWFHPPLVIQPLTQPLTCHFRYVSSLSPRHISFLLAFSFTRTAKFKQLLFNITEILNTYHVCLTSQHYLWCFLSANSSNIKVPLLLSPPSSSPQHQSPGSCSATRAVRNYPAVIG